MPMGLPRILYVDDEVINLELLQLTYMNDFEVITATSAKEGLQMLEVNPDIRVVISDLKMPVMNGLEFIKVVKKGQTFRILDLEGNQAADTLFYNANEPAERYSAIDTIREQGNLYLTTGTKLISNEGNVMLEIVADTCGRCHEGIDRTFRESIHFTGDSKDGHPLPMCDDCHTSHEIARTEWYQEGRLPLHTLKADIDTLIAAICDYATGRGVAEAAE